MCVSLTVDLLHSLYRDACFLSRCTVVADSRRRLGGKHSTQEETVGVAAQCIVHELDAWWRRRQAEFPLEHPTRFHFSRKKHGGVSHLACKRRSAETTGLRVWLVEAWFRPSRLRKHLPIWRRRGRNLLDMIGILNAHGWALPQRAATPCGVVLEGIRTGARGEPRQGDAVEQTHPAGRRVHAVQRSRAGARGTCSLPWVGQTSNSLAK